MVFRNVLNNLGFGGSSEESSVDVTIKDGEIVGNPYMGLSGTKTSLSSAELGLAYDKISCIGTSIDRISENMRTIEPVFWDDKNREAIEYPADLKLIAFRKRLENPNSLDNRRSFISKSVKNYSLFGVVYYLFNLGPKNEIISIKIIDYPLVTPNVDISSNNISYYTVNNSAYEGEYVFDGRYYSHKTNSKQILAPYINSHPDYSYLPSSPVQGAGIEVLMYWYGCYHNKSLLENGARPSLVFMIKQTLKAKFKKALEDSIRVRHSGAGNAGRAIIFDGAADKDVKQLSQNNKDMEFSTMVSEAKESVFERLGTNWILSKKVQSKDFSKAMEMFYDMTVCPMFQGFYNHIFDFYKNFNGNYSHLSIFYLEQDIPALRGRFLSMMKDLPSLQIFTVAERRKMYNYKPLGDERDNELVVQTVKVTQTGASGTNDTGFTGS